jgi:hypothetical protein
MGFIASPVICGRMLARCRAAPWRFGLDGHWVTPYQIFSKSPDGPALVALHWLEEETIRVQRPVLEKFGYLPDIRFNTVIDMALKRQGLKRSDIYVTQTFHLIPQGRSERIPLSAIRRSFDEVTQYELRGRKVIALGGVAAWECTRHRIQHSAVWSSQSARTYQ